MSATHNHFDLQALQQLKEIMADDFAKLVETFTSDSDMRIRTLRDAVAEQDGEQIRQIAHSFKGSAMNLAALPLAELCNTMEHKGQLAELDGCAALLGQIAEEYDQVVNLLSQN